jgi:hypothetical protein
LGGPELSVWQVEEVVPELVLYFYTQYRPYYHHRFNGHPPMVPNRSGPCTQDDAPDLLYYQ